MDIYAFNYRYTRTDVGTRNVPQKREKGEISIDMSPVTIPDSTSSDTGKVEACVL